MTSIPAGHRRISLSLSDQDYRRLYDLAQRYGRSPPAMMRHVLFTALDEDEPEVKECQSK